jgi:DNA-directed RNA polymerase alpha subunit
MKPKSTRKKLLNTELLVFKNSKTGVCINSRLYNILNSCGISTVGDLVAKPLSFYENLVITKRNFGPITLKELMVFVSCLELRFSDN